MDERPGASTFIAFYSIVLIGGLNFVAVKFSNAELDPMFGAGVRFASAALILLTIAAIGRMTLPTGRALAGAAVYGLLSFGLGYALLYIALLGLTAGTASVILAALPLITLVLAVAHRQEKFTARGLFGGLLAVAGVTVISWRSIGNEIPVWSLLAALGGAFASAEASVLVKSFPKAHPITTNAVGMATGSVGLFVASAAFQETWSVPVAARTWLTLAWLVVAGSVALFVLFLFVIRSWTASASVYAITLMPLVAITTGVLIAGEQLRPEVIAGGLLVISGVYVGALSKPRAKAPKEEHSPTVQAVAEGCCGGGLIEAKQETKS